MKGQSVGNVAAILWPSDEDMLALREITCQDYITTELSALDLLWPASLINEQARAKERRDWSRPLAILSFVLTALMAIIVGPMQMILVAAVLDYGWVTTSYYPVALNIVLIASIIVSIINLAALVLAWQARPQRTYLTTVLVAGSVTEIGLIWLTGRVVTWQPHLLTLILLLVLAAFFIAALFINKAYIARTHNNTPTKVALSLMMVLVLAELALGIISIFESNGTGDPERIQQLSSAQEQAHQPEITRTLSDLTYTLCGQPYQIIYASKAAPSGLFECKESGEVFSVTDLRDHNKSVKGSAMYLGTTKNTPISWAFPNSRYLYRELPATETENELALMVAAATEQELVDNITQPLLNYWQDHSEHNLFINIFYNSDLNTVTSTRDFVLMSALDTMVMSPDLPRGDSYEGYWEGKIVPYNYQGDLELLALNELGSDPKLYADSSRIALLTHRHLSLRLSAGENLTYDTLRERLQSSFVGGLEN